MPQRSDRDLKIFSPSPLVSLGLMVELIREHPRFVVECYNPLQDEYFSFKDAGAKLWKELSKVFGEKVKKDNLQSVLRRYLKRNQITLQRNQIMGVNLTVSNLSGAKLLFANISKDSCQADLYQDKIGDNKAELYEPKPKGG